MSEVYKPAKVETNTGRVSEKEQPSIPNAEKIQSEIVTKLREFFLDCEYVPRGAGKIQIKLHIENHEERVKCLMLLELLHVEVWEEEGYLSIEGKYDIATLRLHGLIEEKVFTEDILDQEYNPYAFPLPYGERKQETRTRKNKNTSNQEEVLEIDTELQKREDAFRLGFSPDEEDVDGSGGPADVGFLYRLGSNYEWKKGVCFDKKNGKEITEEEQSELFIKARNGDEKSKDVLLRMHIGLVYFVFRNFIRYYPNNDYDDLLQTGVIELSRVIGEYDSAKGKFSSYAVPCIEGRMRTISPMRGPIHIPIHLSERKNKYHLINNRSISPEEKKRELERLASSFGFKSIDAFKDAYFIDVEMITDSDLSYDDQRVTEDMHTEENASFARTPEFEILQKKLNLDIERLLDTLTPREAKVLRGRFFQNSSQETIGMQFDVTRGRINQIEAKALRKLVHPSRKEVLEGYPHYKDMAYSLDFEQQEFFHVHYTDGGIYGRHIQLTADEFKNVVLTAYRNKSLPLETIAKKIGLSPFFIASYLNWFLSRNKQFEYMQVEIEDFLPPEEEE